VPPRNGTQTGDVFSVGILLFNILYRLPPHQTDDFTALVPRGRSPYADSETDVVPKRSLHSDVVACYSRLFVTATLGLFPNHFCFDLCVGGAEIDGHGNDRPNCSTT